MITAAVGDSAQMGLIAASLGIDHATRTPLEQKLEELAGIISKFGHAMAILIFGTLLVRGVMFGEVTGLNIGTANHLLHYIMLAVVIVVAAVPEGLPMSVALSLSLAMRKMTKANCLVRRLIACETIGSATTVCTDKTGTLTLGKPRLITTLEPHSLCAASALARCSRHPLSRALVEAAGPGKPAQSAQEFAGEGISGEVDGVPARLGRRSFAAPSADESQDGAAELWFTLGDAPPLRMCFVDELRPDAKSVIEAMQRRGLAIQVLSGDRSAAVADAARAAGVTAWIAESRPADKVAHLETLRAAGRKVLMVGDGLNDAAALAAAHASASPGCAVEVSQAAADIVFTGVRLAPLVDAIDTARAAHGRITENLAASAIYNVIAVPIAALGLVTPLIAAVAMAGSSLIVTLNALRLQGMRSWTS